MRPNIRFNPRVPSKMLLVSLSRWARPVGSMRAGSPVWHPHVRPSALSLFTTFNRVSNSPYRDFFNVFTTPKVTSYLGRGGVFTNKTMQFRRIIPRFRLYVRKCLLTKRDLVLRGLSRKTRRPLYVKWWGAVVSGQRLHLEEVNFNLLSWLDQPVLAYFFEKCASIGGGADLAVHVKRCGVTGFNFCGVYLDWYAFWSRIGVIGISPEHGYTPAPIQPGVQLASAFKHFILMSTPTPQSVGPWGLTVTGVGGDLFGGVVPTFLGVPGPAPKQDVFTNTEEVPTEEVLADGSFTIAEDDSVSANLLGSYVETLTHYFMGVQTLRSAYAYRLFKMLVSPYLHASHVRSWWGEGLGGSTRWVCFLTFHFKKRSLYVGLQQPGVGCIFSLSSGMFLPNYRQYWLPQKLQKLHLKYRQSLGHKDRKEFNKKRQVVSWKCKRFTYSTKMFLVNYIKLWLVWARPLKLCVILHGVARGWRHLLFEALRGGDSIEKRRLAKHSIICTCIYGGFRCTASKRAISRRLTKQMWKATKVSKFTN